MPQAYARAAMAQIPISAGRTQAGSSAAAVTGSSAAISSPRTAGGATLSFVIGTNQFRNGSHIDIDGTVFKILEFQHVKPGKGGAFVRTKLRRGGGGERGETTNPPPGGGRA